MHRAGVDRSRHSCVCVKGDDGRCGGGEGRVRDQKRKLSISCGHKLKPTKDFGGEGLAGAEFGAHSSSVEGQCGWELHMERLSHMRLLGRGLLRVA